MKSFSSYSFWTYMPRCFFTEWFEENITIFRLKQIRDSREKTTSRTDWWPLTKQIIVFVGDSWWKSNCVADIWKRCLIVSTAGIFVINSGFRGSSVILSLSMDSKLDWSILLDSSEVFVRIEPHPRSRTNQTQFACSKQLHENLESKLVQLELPNQSKASYINHWIGFEAKITTNSTIPRWFRPNSINPHNSDATDAS